MNRQKRILMILILIIGLTAFTLSGMNWNLGIAAWIAPVFLLYFTRQTRWPGFLLFFLGMALSAGISKTAENLSGIFLIYITTGLSYGIFYSLPYLLEKILVRKESRLYATLIFPAAVVSLEYLLSLLLGIWGHSAIAQYHWFQLIQITSLLGVFGISFLVAWFASVLNWIFIHKAGNSYLLKGLGIYGLVLLLVLTFGSLRTRLFPPAGDRVKVAAISSDTDILELFNAREKEIIELSKNPSTEVPGDIYSSPASIHAQIERTTEALDQGAKIVVWNELSLILNRSQLDPMMIQLKDLCKKNQAYVLIAFLEKDISSSVKPFNNKAILITPEGETGWEYLKSNLNPMEKLIINKGDFSIPYVDSEYGRIGNVICYDLDYSGFIRQAGKKELDILLVPAFDWEQITPYHSHMAAFAAIQYGVSIVRSNGKGLVAAYDFQGRELAKMDTFHTSEKSLYAEIPVQSVNTLYAAIGDIFVYVMMLFLMGMAVSRLIKRTRV